MNKKTSSKLTVLLGFLALCCTSASAQEIDWGHDLQSAMARATAEKKLVLLHFTASWCRPCKSLDRFVFPNRDVIRAVEVNVVPVEIDVDSDQNIVTEYGVTAVPYDVIITPNGRVITKRKSPLDARGYLRMFAKLSTPVKELEDGSNPALAQQLNDFKNQFDFKPSKLAEFKNFRPGAPSHTAPVTSSDSAELARNARVTNPFVATATATAAMPPVAPLKKTNSFVASPVVKKDRPEQKLIANSFVSKSDTDFDRPAVATGPAVSKANVAGVVLAEVSDPQLQPQPQVKVRPAPQVEASVGIAGIKQRPSNSDFATRAVAPRTIQNDRFFKDPIQIDPAPKTRVVAPNLTAQRLLEPVLDPPLAKFQTSGGDLEQPFDRSKSDRSSNQFMARAFKSDPVVPPGRQQELVKPTVNVKQLISSNEKTRSPAAVPLAPQLSGTPTLPRQNTSQKFGLRGKCPVSLLQQRQWIAGDPKFGCVHRDQLYIFADEAKLKLFQADPDFYSPILAGFDPVVFHETGQLVDGLEQHGVFMGKAPNQRIVLFGSAEGRSSFQGNPELYLGTVRQAMNASGGSSSPMLR